MPATPLEELQELTFQLSNALPKVSDSLRSDAYAMQNCRHTGLISNCHSPFCLMCVRRRAEVRNTKLHDRLHLLQANFPSARFLFATLPIEDTSTTNIGSSASRLKKTWDGLLKPVHGLIGHFTALEVAASEKTPELENVHLHSLVALNPSVHAGDNYINYDKWAANWRDVMQGLARDTTIVRARNPTHIIDYNLKSSPKRFIERALEALANPARYVERVMQLWKFPKHWYSGELGRIAIPPPIPEDVLSGLNNVKGRDMEYQMAKTSRPRTKNHPIPIAEN